MSEEVDYEATIDMLRLELLECQQSHAVAIVPVNWLADFEAPEQRLIRFARRYSRLPTNMQGHDSYLLIAKMCNLLDDLDKVPDAD